MKLLQFSKRVHLRYFSTAIPKIIVVGGVAGGATAAAKARRVNEKAEIIMFEKGPYVSFANCGLPYYVGGEIADRSKLLLHNPQSFWNRYKISARPLQEVVHINKTKKTVTVNDLEKGKTYEESYDKLILCPGARAIEPPIPGIKSANVFTVKTVPDSDKIRAFVEKYHPKNAVVIGAGFIGLETAEQLHRLGLNVTICELQDQVLPPLDKNMASILEVHLKSKGWNLSLGDGLKSFTTKKEGDEELVTGVVLNSGIKVDCDLAILSIGVRPETQLAKDANLSLGKTGYIEVNKYMQTSDPDIYAAGDAVEVTNLITNRKESCPLAGPANKQGRIAGANAAGAQPLMEYNGVIPTAIVGVMGLTAAITGLSEKLCQRYGIEYNVIEMWQKDHASFYPGATDMCLKVITEKQSGRILGGQIVGINGVDKRIDVISTAIYARLKGSDLENLDLAYAPQYGSAKDAVVQVGFSWTDVHRKEVKTMSATDLLKEKEDIQLIDVRTSNEYKKGYIPGAKNVPLHELRDKLNTLDKKKKTVVYCLAGFRGYLASRILVQNGFENVYNLMGGWQSASVLL